MSRKKLIWILLLFVHFKIFSQEKAIVPVEFKNQTLSEILFSLEAMFDVRFSYQNAIISNDRLSLKKQKRSLKEVLEELTLMTDVSFQFIDSRYIIMNAAPNPTDLEVLDKVVVKVYLTQGLTKNKDASFTIKPKELGILPGLTEADVLESIQQLPGVLSVNETASGLLVRGGKIDQNRILWDGITIYHKGHLFGMISPFNPSSIEKVDFINKGTHARYGERVSSVVNIHSRLEVADSLSAGIGVNGLNADAYVDLPLISEKLSLHTAIRRSYGEVYESNTLRNIYDKVFQTTKIGMVENSSNDFYYTDFNFKLNYQPNENNLLAISGIYIDNNLDYLINDPEINQSFNDLLNISNEGYSFNWDKEWSRNVSQQTQGYFSKYQLTYNFIENQNSIQVSDFEKRNVIFDSGLSSELKIRTSNNNTLFTGYQYSLKDVGYAFLETSDLAFVLDTDERVINTHAFYGSNNYRNKRIANIDVGLRMNYFKELKSLKFEPRVLIYKEVFKNLTLQFSGEIKNQIISEIDETILSDLSLENKLWRLADGEAFPIINSRQVSMGLIYSRRGWVADLDLYYKNVNGLTSLSLGFLNPEESGYRIGEQKVKGLDLFLKKDFKFFKTWISYSFNDVRNKFEGLNNEAYFVANTEIRHSFTASLAYKLEQFQLALAWNWRSGKPFTESILSEDGKRLYFEEINTGKLPDYHRLDFSSTYSFNFSSANKLKGKVGVSVRNVYNQNNYLSLEYIGNNSLEDPIVRVDKYSLRFTPNFLFKVFW